FPACKEKMCIETKIEKEAEVKSGEERRILVVEDDEAIKYLVTTLLRENNFVVFEAANGQDALKLFEAEKGRIDLLFSDSVMPGMSGLELAKEIIEKNPKVKIIISSGYLDDRSNIAEALASNFHFLPKPYEIKLLLSEVFKVLEGEPPGH
ncbi:MAG: response regulator, partial [Candidatus Firestonebacteria bacterium]